MSKNIHSINHLGEENEIFWRPWKLFWIYLYSFEYEHFKLDIDFWKATCNVLILLIAYLRGKECSS